MKIAGLIIMILLTGIYSQECGSCQNTFNCPDGCACPADGFYCTSTCCQGNICKSNSVCSGEDNKITALEIALIVLACVVLLLCIMMVCACCCGIC